MNIWSKMLAALKGGVNEAGEYIMDEQALRILDQEMREANAELGENRDHLNSLVADKKVALDKKEALLADISLHEGYAVKALEQNDEALALEVALEIARQKEWVEESDKQIKTTERHIKQLEQAVSVAEVNLARIRQQLDTVRANQSVLRAQKAVASRYAGKESRLATALDTLDRIQEQQAQEQARVEATDQSGAVGKDALKERLAAAGIIGPKQQASEILAEIKAGLKGK